MNIQFVDEDDRRQAQVVEDIYVAMAWEIEDRKLHGRFTLPLCSGCGRLR